MWTVLSQALQHCGALESPLGVKTVRKLLQVCSPHFPLSSARGCPVQFVHDLKCVFIAGFPALVGVQEIRFAAEHVVGEGHGTSLGAPGVLLPCLLRVLAQLVVPPSSQGRFGLMVSVPNTLVRGEPLSTEDTWLVGGFGRVHTFLLDNFRCPSRSCAYCWAHCWM